MHKLAFWSVRFLIGCVAMGPLLPLKWWVVGISAPVRALAVVAFLTWGASILALAWKHEKRLARWPSYRTCSDERDVHVPVAESVG